MALHYPVMLPQVLESLSPVPGGVYVDGTFGGGGYTKAILDAVDCTVVSIDRDPSAQGAADKLREEYGERFIFLKGCFGDVADLLAAADILKVDGFVLDLGVSSMQIDEAARGFSFRHDGPLDMRMGDEGASAADLVNETEEQELANIIYEYGEERKSRQIASAIVRVRAETPFETTEQLAEVIRGVIPKRPKDKIDPATRTFQALRIAVNDELGELKRALASSENILNADGRLVVVTFHSLEDRIVKNFMREKAGQVSGGSRHMPEAAAPDAAVFEILTRKAVLPSDQEVSENSRSRSAKLRAAKYLEAA